MKSDHIIYLSAEKKRFDYTIYVWEENNKNWTIAEQGKVNAPTGSNKEYNEMMNKIIS